MQKIWCRGKYWPVNEYNKRLSEENKIIEKFQEKARRLDSEEEGLIQKVWKRKK